MRPGLATSLAPLVATVQHNCDLSDARHARDGALCTYLLGMRELFRWSSGAAPGAPLDRRRIGVFITEREAAWDQFDDNAPYRALPLGTGVDAFDESLTDTLLLPHRLVYGGGVGRFGAPLFFLAERAREALEYGTQPVPDVMLALRADNWLHLHGDVGSAQGRAIKRQVRDAHTGVCHTLGGPGVVSAVMVLGRERGLAVASRLGAGAIVVDEQGEVGMTPELAAILTLLHPPRRS